MGFLSNLVDENATKKADEAKHKAASLTALIHDDDAKPDQKAWAMGELTKHAGLSKKESDNLLKMVAQMTGGASAGGGDKPQGQSEVPTEPSPNPKSLDKPIQYPDMNELPLPQQRLPSDLLNDGSGTADGSEPVRSGPVPQTPEKKKHPIRNFLLSTLAGGLSGGETVRQQYQQEAEKRAEATRGRESTQASQLREKEDIDREKRQQAWEISPEKLDLYRKQLEAKGVTDRIEQGKILAQFQSEVKKRVDGGMDAEDARREVSEGMGLPYHAPPAVAHRVGAPVQTQDESGKPVQRIYYSDGTYSDEPPAVAKPEKLPAGLNEWYQSIKVQWEQQKGSPLTPEENKQALSVAGKLNERSRLGQIEARDITTAINKELSGLSGGGAAAPNYPGAAQKPSAGPATTPAPKGGAGAGPATPKEPPAPPVTYTRPDGKAVTLTPAEEQLMDRFRFLMSTNAAASGRSGAMQVGFTKAQGLLQKITGLSPEQLAAAFAEKRSDLKAVTENVTRLNSLNRINMTLENQGQVLTKAASMVDETGSPIVNKLVRGVESGVAGAPSVAQFQVALNAVARDYAAAQSSGGISQASIPVHNAEEAAKLFSTGATSGQLAGILDTIHQEVAASKSAQEQNQRDLLQNMGAPVVGPNGGGGTGATPTAAPIIQKNKTTWAFRYSTDGGKTWLKGKPPGQ